MESIKASEKMDQLIKLDFNEQRVLTTQQLAYVYETEERRITENFRRNQSRFIEGKHYIKLEGDLLKYFKCKYAKSVPANVNKLYLWTEKGANRHCKILDTDKAWEQFDVLEDTYFNLKSKKMLSPSQILELQLQAIKENESKISAVDEDLQNFKTDIPLFGNEQYDLQKLVKSKGTSVLGGRKSLAYRNKSLRQRLYSDLQREIKRQFGVNTYRAIKRSQLEQAKEIVNKYTAPLSLAEEINMVNSQLVLDGDSYEQ